MNQQLFKYNKNRIARFLGYTLLPGFMILTLLLVYGLMAIDLVQHVMRLSPNSEFNNSPIVWLVAILLPVLLIWVAISLHVSQPTIRIHKDKTGFRIETQFYKSNWFAWRDITNIKTVRTPLSTGPAYAIELDRLNIFFILAAFNASIAGRAFIIGKDMDQLYSLLAHLRYQRPDLFE